MAILLLGASLFVGCTSATPSPVGDPVIELTLITEGDPPFAQRALIYESGSISLHRTGRRMVRRNLGPERIQAVLEHLGEPPTLPPSWSPPGSWHARRVQVRFRDQVEVYVVAGLPGRPSPLVRSLDSLLRAAFGSRFLGIFEAPSGSVLGGADPAHETGPSLVQETLWTNSWYRVRGVVELTFADSRTVLIHATITNEGQDPVYLMTVFPWHAQMQDTGSGLAYLIFGDPHINYGNSFPALGAISPGALHETSTRLQLPKDLSEIARLDVVFFGIFEKPGEVEAIRSQVEDYAGRWQTGSLELADRYRNLLAEYLVSTPVPQELVGRVESAPAP